MINMAALRKVVSPKLTVSDIVDLAIRKNPELAKMIVETGPMFDASAHDLKVYLLVLLRVTPEEYLSHVPGP
jgi:hypothetical protein